MTLQLAKIIENYKVSIMIGNNVEWFKKQGYTLLDVEQSEIDNQWYLAKYCPHKEKSVLFSEWYRMGFSPGKTGGSQSAGLYTGAGIGCDQSLF